MMFVSSWKQWNVYIVINFTSRADTRPLRPLGAHRTYSYIVGPAGHVLLFTVYTSQNDCLIAIDHSMTGVPARKHDQQISKTKGYAMNFLTKHHLPGYRK